MYTIGNVAQRFGIRTSTLRYYEEFGLLPPPQRVNGQRRYDEAIFQRINLIHMAQKLGFTLAQIQQMQENLDRSPSLIWQQFAIPKLAELETLIQQAQQMKLLLEKTLDCTCESLTACSGHLSENQRGAA